MESSQKRTGSIPIYSCMSAVNISLLVKLQSLQFCDDVILHQERDLFVLPEVRQISPQQFLFALTFLFYPFFPPASQGLPEVTVTCPLLQTILRQNLSKLNPHRPSDISYSGEWHKSWPSANLPDPPWPSSGDHQCICRARFQETCLWSHPDPHLQSPNFRNSQSLGDATWGSMCKGKLSIKNGCQWLLAISCNSVSEGLCFECCFHCCLWPCNTRIIDSSD